MERPLKLFALLAVVLGLAVGLAACGGGDSGSAAEEPAGETTAPPAEEPAETAAPAETGEADAGGEPSGEPIVLGFAIAETGLMNFFDGPVLNGAQLAVADINAAGGVLGRPLEIITVDHKSDFAQIEPAALEVIEQGADVVFPSCDYDFGGPAARVAGQNGLVAIACAGSPLFGKEGVGPLAFNTYQATPSEGTAMAKVLAEQGWNNVYVLQDTSLDYSKTVCDYFETAWANLGGEIAGKDTFQNADPSIQAQVTKMKGADFDALVVCSYPPGGGAAIKQIRDGGIEAPIVASGAFDGTYWLEGVPNLGEFYYVAPMSKFGDPWNNELIAAYTEAYGPPPNALYPHAGYAAVETIARAIERAGTTEGEALAAEIQTFTDEELVMGPTTYTPDCNIPYGRDMAKIQIVDGVPTYLGDIEIDVEELPEDRPC